MAASIAKSTSLGLVEIQSGTAFKWVLFVNNAIVAQSNDWGFIKGLYDNYC